ncbi:MAG: cyclic nucleotide-binding domain-containing protein [Panacagrimonas sp.]
MSGTDPAIATLFSRFVPLGGLRRERQVDLARKSVLLHRRQGEYLFRIGDISGGALFLVEGTLDLLDQWGHGTVGLSAGSEEARHRIAHASPRKFDARCVTDVSCLQIDGHLLDVILTWDQSDSFEVGELQSTAPRDSDDWMTRLLQMRSFQRVPPANLQAMFLRMERIEARAGQVIVRQGDEGDFFYVITKGRCLVTREQPNQRSVRLAELETGSCFGEESLIADAPRNATVTMLTRGSLMRLAKQDFQILLNEPLARRTPHAEAAQRVASGAARYLDVRLPSEFMNRHLPGSFNIPLYMLRMRTAQLDPQLSYICICDTGRRSSVASFVLTQKGFDAWILDGGLGGVC